MSSAAPGNGDLGLAKKIIYFGENALSDIQGGGIVVRQVLMGLPAEDVLGIYEYLNNTVAPEYHGRFHRLANCWPFPKFLAAPLAALRQLGLLDLWQWIDYLLRFFFFRPCLAADMKWVRRTVAADGFEPEVVYFCGLSLRYLTMAVMTAKHFDLPMVVLHMDDWPAAEELRVPRPLRALWRRRTLDTIAEAASRTLVGTTNSPALANRLKELTGCHFDAANNCNADIAPLLDGDLTPAVNSVPTLVYAGALNLHLQGGTLLRLARAISELNFEGTPCRLKVFTPVEFAPLINAIASPGVVEYGGHLGMNQLVREFRDADFLVLSTAFFGEGVALFRYSLATKLSDYLCLSKPVISIGNPDWSVHHYVREHGCGFSITVGDRESIKVELRKVLTVPPAERDRIGQANRVLWEKQHDVRIMSRATREALGLAPLQ